MSRLLFQGVEGVADISDQILGAPGLEFETRDGALCDPDPKLHEECGVVAIHGHPDAAREVYLGLYALQHRGQESAGIASADGTRLAGETRAIELTVFNAAGQKIRTIAWGETAVGVHKVVWDGKNNSGRMSPAGFYVAELKCNGMKQVVKMLKVN